MKRPLILLLGLLLTIATTWACALWTPLGIQIDRFDSVSPNNEPLILRRSYHAGWLSRLLPCVQADTFHEPPSSRAGAADPAPPRITRDTISTGWPLLAMEWDTFNAREWSFEHSPITHLWRMGLRIPNLSQSGEDFRELPIRPRWPGFLINWLFYSSLIALPLYALPWYRRHRRRQPGRCPTCAYDATGLPRCPECGAAIPIPANPTTSTSALPTHTTSR